MNRQSADSGIKGKYVLITGATSGIGLAAARELARQGAHLGIVARNAVKAAKVADRLRGFAGADLTIDVFSADLASQQSIRQAAAAIRARRPRVDVLINNAGAMFAKRHLTADGIEMTWAVNHLAPFLLTTLLLDRLAASGPARVITTTSHGHKMARDGIRFADLNARRYYSFPGSWAGGPNYRYGETKLANILFTAELARRTAGSGIIAACYDPGLVATNFNQDNGSMARLTMSILKRFSVSPEQGAATMLWLASAPTAAVKSGGYYKNQQLVTPSAPALDAAMAKQLWDVSEQQIQATGSDLQ